MPRLVGKLFVFATVNGLFLQPANRLPADPGGVRIEYGTNRILSASSNDDGAGHGLEVHGIVGLLNLVSSSYLIFITRREQVARIRDSPIFRVTEVTLIPLKSKEAAEQAILSAQEVLNQRKRPVPCSNREDSDGSNDTETASVASVDTVDMPGHEQKRAPRDEAAALEPPKGGVVKRSTTFVKDVVQDRGKYGRFVSNWFARTGSKEGVRRRQGMPPGGNTGLELTEEQGKQMDEALPERDDNTIDREHIEDRAEARQKSDSTAGKPSGQQSAIEHLTPRILNTTRLYFSNGAFYFSYDHDISNSLAQASTTKSSVPLWKCFDPLFFWNRHLQAPFVDAGQDSLVLPLMQGFVGQRLFSIGTPGGLDEHNVAQVVGAPILESRSNRSTPTEVIKQDFLLTLISRRSIRRAGLRYLRRGVNDDGAVANNVETEQILSPVDWNEQQKTFSLLQIRGSIPLFFSQSPYSFKPLPVTFGSKATNQAALRKHFNSIMNRYGRVHCASLVDKHGTEKSIGEAYQETAKAVNEQDGSDAKPIGFDWFDFHSACRGMKFENVQILLDDLQGQLESFGWTSKQNDRNVRHQSGVLRTNCMDCLDRTNVVQSAVAGWVLQQQLAELGLNIDLRTDTKTQWFNSLWADNGDAISKQYAGTSALKGDFTRTRKRDWTGALSDFSLTLNRYYNNSSYQHQPNTYPSVQLTNILPVFGDYLLQTNIDFWLGNSPPTVYDEFESDMKSQDYALDMPHVRQNAIESCVKIVLEDPQEDLLDSWTLNSPRQSNSLRTFPFEECVLLLTTSALYFCRFDWDTEKVGSFERVDLNDVKELYWGAYITSALGGTHMDVSKNVGFVLRYKTEGEGKGIVRTNTRSLSNTHDVRTEESDEETPADERRLPAPSKKKQEETRFLAFKALPPKAFSANTKDEARSLADMDEAELVQHVCQEIQGAIMKVSSGFQQAGVSKPVEVQERDVIGVTEAKKSTGYMESLGYSLKKLVWS